MNEKLIKRAARSWLRDKANHTVEIEPGDSVPRWEGESYYWTTPSGKTIVHHPSSYRWPTTYHHSTLRIVVGRGWARRQRLRIEGEKLRGVRYWIHGCRVQLLFAKEGVYWLCERRGCDPYHVSVKSPRWGGEHATSPVAALRLAVSSWRRQRVVTERFEQLKRDRVYVSVEDSIRAGNCASMTEEFARRMREKIGASGECAVLASEVLAVRDDSYTRRAAFAAAERYV